MLMYGDAMGGKNTKLHAVLMYLKLAAALILMAVMAYAFTFHLDGDIGVVIWSFLIIAPLLSFLLTFRGRKNVHVTLEAPTYVAKGKGFAATVRLGSDGKLPVPFVRFGMQPSPCFSQSDARMVQCSLMPGEPLEIRQSMTAAYAGCGKLALDTAEISDYLGLINLTIRALPESLTVGVIPEIPSLTDAGVMLHTVTDIVATQDEDEEESSAAFSSVSMPGYIHRDYVPGDNLRRINWKLSAKRQKLMVRMDEAAATVRPSVILDLCNAEYTEQQLKMRETLMEGALGFLMLLVRQGIACSLRFASECGWKCIVLENEDAVRAAAVDLATADLRHDGCRLDRSALQEKAGAFLVYTANPDAELSQTFSQFQGKGYLCCVIPEKLNADALSHTDAVWTLSEDFTMTAQQK